MAEIVPTILTADPDEFSQKINLIKGVVERVQIDVVDGKFAPKKTVALETIKSLESSGEWMTKMKLDLHLMVDKPEDWVNRSLALLPDRIIGHIEMMADPREFISRVVEGGAEAGLALDLETSVAAIPEDFYHLADLVLILSVKAGMSGQEFSKKAVEKLNQVKKIVDDLVKIGIDGGLDEKSISLCKKGGAEIFYVGNSFWKAEDLGKRYNELFALIK